MKYVCLPKAVVSEQREATQASSCLSSILQTSCSDTLTLTHPSFTMIRLPPTSISLSDNDLAFHLQQIDIYHGLLKQGFKKRDIIRYFNEHNAAQQLQPAPPIDLGPPTLTHIELAARGPRSHEPPAPAPQPRPKSPTTPESSQALTPSARPTSQQIGPKIDDRPTSVSPNLPASLQGHRHAPRQSSLLRFAQVVSSSSSDRTEHANSLVALPARTYRQRTDTYSYSQSDGSEPELVNGISDLHIASPINPDTARKIRNASPPSWAEAETFVPGRLRPWTSRTSTRRISQDIANAGEKAASKLDSQQTDLIESITPRLVSQNETLRQINIVDQSRAEFTIPSSPPDTDDSTSTDSSRYYTSLSPTLPPMPATPTPVRWTERTAHTEPRHARHQYLDGTSFPVYNDDLPADAQPQTPADLSRHPLLTEQDAAYTAPPGVLHTGSPVRRLRPAIAELHTEHGEQTPMAHAMGSRERRARELIRSVRAEGVRLQRLRQQDRERIASGLDGNDEIRDRDGPGPAIATELWRDDFEGDRVGDENWEGNGDGTPRRGNGMRVTSGNARDNWWEER